MVSKLIKDSDKNLIEILLEGRERAGKRDMSSLNEKGE